MTTIQCPHVSVADLAETWNVSKRTIQRWLADDGITPVIRGRYRLADIERYAEKKGKPKYTKMESYEIGKLQKEVEELQAQLTAEKKKRLEIVSLAAADLAKVIY